MAIITRSLQHKRDTIANFASTNPVLLAGQIGIETDGLLTSPKFKIGNGTTAWNDLPYMSGGGGTWGSITGTVTAQTDLITYLNSQLIIGNFLIVDRDNGDNSTATRGTLNYMYEDIVSAQTDAVSGDVIIVNPSADVYTDSAIGNKNGITYFFHRGATVSAADGAIFQPSSKSIAILGEGVFINNGGTVLTCSGTSTVIFQCRYFQRTDTGGAAISNNSNSTLYLRAIEPCTSEQNGIYTGTTSTSYLKLSKLTVKRAAIISIGTTSKVFLDIDEIYATDTVLNVTTPFFCSGGTINANFKRAILSNPSTTNAAISFSNTATSEMNLNGDIQVVASEPFFYGMGENDTLWHRGRLIGSGTKVVGSSTHVIEDFELEQNELSLISTFLYLTGN